MTIRVAHLYPEYLNIYADRGNIAVLSSRARWRGIGFEVEAVSLGDELRPGEHDLLYIGGGQDREQGLIAPDLARASRGDPGGGRRRSGRARRVRRVPASGPVLSWTGRRRASRRRALSAGHGCGRPADDRRLPAGVRARAGRAADAGRLREPRGRHAARRGRRAAGPGGRGVRERRRERLRGRSRRERDRHVSPRPLAAPQCVVGRLDPRARARAPNRRATELDPLPDELEDSAHAVAAERARARGGRY